MSVHRRGDGWRVRYRDAAGNQRSQAFDRKADADSFDIEVRRRRQLGVLHTVTAKPATLDRYVEETWAPTYGPLLAPRTRTVYAWAYDLHISPQLGHVELHAITPSLLARWQAAEINAGAGHETLRKSRRVLGAILRTAIEAGLIQTNPVAAMRVPRAPLKDEVRPLAPDAVEAIRARLDHRDAVLVSLLAYAGLRPGEARALRWGHVHERTIVIGAAKTASRRTVRLLGPLREDLLAWRMASGRPDDDAPVIPADDGGELTEAQFIQWRRSAWAQALKTAGIPDVRPYVLRHSFASLLAHEGRSIVYIAKQLGHGPELSLRTYQHVIDELEDAPKIPAEQAIRQARAQPDAPAVRPR